MSRIIVNRKSAHSDYLNHYPITFVFNASILIGVKTDNLHIRKLKPSKKRFNGANGREVMYLINDSDVLTSYLYGYFPRSRVGNYADSFTLNGGFSLCDYRYYRESRLALKSEYQSLHEYLILRIPDLIIVNPSLYLCYRDDVTGVTTDICCIDDDIEIDVNDALFVHIYTYYKKCMTKTHKTR